MPQQEEIIRVFTKYDPVPNILRMRVEGEIVDYEDYKIEHGLEDVIFVHYRRK